MRITTEEVRHIALLARVGMTDEDIELMRDQLSNILEQFDILQQVDTEEVEATGHLAYLSTVMRDDVAAKSRPREDMLSNAPQREGDFIKIRAVLE